MVVVRDPAGRSFRRYVPTPRQFQVLVVLGGVSHLQQRNILPLSGVFCYICSPRPLDTHQVPVARVPRWTRDYYLCSC